MVTRRLLAALLLGLACVTAAAENLETAVQQQVLGATFEVVQLKPAEGAVTYERELPLDLLPYQQRIDKYRSVGTAFAIAPNHYITAGHVLAAGQDSQFGPPALRDAAGNVYEIDEVLKYSDDQDFVEFSLKKAPPQEKFLAVATSPPLNETVFAVGNALGEGVVIRDGVFTSETPEEASGRWKWLRFSAAASPGNSGGPLVDRDGKVIGIVLRKSASENLNVAAPMSLVAAAPDSKGTVDVRNNFRLPVLDASEVMMLHETMPLPATLSAFYAAMHRIENAMVVRNIALSLDHNKDRMFPNSATSTQVLHEVLRSPFPRLIREEQDRNWGVTGPQVKDAQLENNGFVRYGGFLLRLRAPNDTKLATLYGDSKLYMDMMLRSGFSLNRTIGSAHIKVTSLGRAIEESTSVDTWGRTWRVKIFAVPYDDAYVVTMSLPTPEGYAAIFMTVRSVGKDVLVAEQKLLADFTYVSFEGTLAQWRDYLPLTQYQPKVFAGLKINIAPDYSRLTFNSPRAELVVTPEVLPLSATTMFGLDLAYFKDAGTVVWDVAGIVVGEDGHKNDLIEVYRHALPETSLSDKYKDNWKKIEAGEFPYNGVATDDTGGMRAGVAVPAPGGSARDAIKVRYSLHLRKEGAPGQDVMHAQLEALRKAFKTLEH